MKVAVLKETFPGERRVALVPGVVPGLVKAGVEVLVESGAGAGTGYTDDDYRHAGARVDGVTVGGGAHEDPGDDLLRRTTTGLLHGAHDLRHVGGGARRRRRVRDSGRTSWRSAPC